MSEEKDYINTFLDESSIVEDGAQSYSPAAVVSYPEWVSEDNLSMKAYDEIENLKKIRMRYISMSKSKSDLNKKSTYQISKVEVARALGVKPQPLFHSDTTTYSEKLLEYIDDVNSNLLAKREFKLNRRKNGINNRSKDELASEFKAQKKELLVRKEHLIDELYKRFKAELPLDVKAKLKIR